MLSAHSLNMPSDLSCAYLFCHANGQSFKIGKSNRPFARLNELPEDIDLERSMVLTVAKDDVFRAEKGLQAVFRYWRLDKAAAEGYTEWFDISQMQRVIRYIHENKDLICWKHFESLLAHLERLSGVRLKIVENSFAFENGLKVCPSFSNGDIAIANIDDVKNAAFLKAGKLIFDLCYSHSFNPEFRGLFFETRCGVRECFYDEYFMSAALQDSCLSYSSPTMVVSRSYVFGSYSKVTVEEFAIDKRHFKNICITWCMEWFDKLLMEADKHGLLPIVQERLMSSRYTMSQVAVYSSSANEIMKKLDDGRFKTRELDRPMIYDRVRSLVEQLAFDWLPHRRPAAFIDHINIVLTMFEDCSRIIESGQKDAALAKFFQKNLDVIDQLTFFMGHTNFRFMTGVRAYIKCSVTN
jgi:hypothetical protein